MKNNVGNVDKWIRVVVGVILILIPFILLETPLGVAGIILIIIGLLMLVTGLLTKCPMYHIFGVSTCKTDK